MRFSGRLGRPGERTSPRRRKSCIVGALELDILLGDVRSLKEKRAVVKPVLAELRRYGVCAAETGEQDRYRRSMLGVAMASAAVDHVHEVLDTCERHVAGRRNCNCSRSGEGFSAPRTDSCPPHRGPACRMNYATQQLHNLSSGQGEELIVMVDPARARKLAKRIAHDRRDSDRARDQGSAAAFVTITDAKVTADLHDATVYYTVMGADLEHRTGPRGRCRRAREGQGRICAPRWAQAPASGSPRR